MEPTEPFLPNQLLRDALRGASVAQAQLARLTGVSAGRISEYVNDKLPLSIKQLKRLMAPLGQHVIVSVVSSDADAKADTERQIYRERGKALERVVATASALPRRDPGPLGFPPFRKLLNRG